MRWIWENNDWPNYHYDASAFVERIAEFSLKSERLYGRIEALPNSYQTDALVDLMLSEAIKTSAIEGENLDRESVRSSLLSMIGIDTASDSQDVKAKGAAALMVDVREHWDHPLSAELLGNWQSCVIADQITSNVMRGAYRNADEAMQIISGRIGDYNIHYEAPPAADVPAEMERFIDWYNATSPVTGDGSLPGPIRAAVAHVWFENIHPFDDGNGRVGRAVADHALSQSLGFPTMACLATAIEGDKKTYYAELERVGRGDLDLNRWVDYFTQEVNQAQDIAKDEVDFILGKTRFYDTFGDQLNERQGKVVGRIFSEGRKGFEGGLTTKKYQAITKCSRATAFRDLTGMLEGGVIVLQQGRGRSTHYELATVAPVVSCKYR
ncbi:MAG: Fic family protein [Candidatus Sedimenticola sp. (ex Thyasira tokunagai)]